MHFLSITGYPGVIEVGSIKYTAGLGDHYYPILDIQVDLTCNVLKPAERYIPYSIIGLSALLRLMNKHLSHSPMQYIFNDVKERANTYPCHFQFPLDLRRIERIEEIRRGDDAKFEISIEGMGTILEKDNTREVIRIKSDNPIQIKIDQSHWVKNILPVWNYGQAKLIEIYFPKTYKHKILKESYQHIEKAISHFNNGNDRETLASIYSAFELMTKQIGYENPDHNFFSKFLENVEDDKRDKLKLLLDYFCRYLHLGRHEPNKPPVSIERKDSEFALTMVQLIYSYLSKILPKESK